MTFASPPQAPERLHALDAVRAFALLAGIAFHATLSFLPGPQVWVVMDSQRSEALSVGFYVLHIFRMTTFFLIAGFFARMSLEKRGLWGFVGDRLKRIALPLAVMWPILITAIVAMFIWGASTSGALPSNAPPPPLPTAATFPLTHLWFLYVLLMLYAGALLLRGVARTIDWGGWLSRATDRLAGALIGNPLGLILLAAPLGAWLFYAPKWLPWFGIPTPDTGLVPNAAALIGFGTAFGLGWLLNRRIDLLQALQRRWLLNLVLATGLIVACVFQAGPEPRLTPMPRDGAKLIYAGCYVLAIWTSTFALIGLAQRFLSGYSAARRYLADASYWLYLIHLPVVMAGQILVARLDWPWPLKFAAILGVSVPLMLVSYQLLVRHSFIGRILNGPRPRRARAAPDVALPAPVDAA
ncbi:MAG: acyltransferase family protein [Proteobacteria bacterium]|nr:acyltransferase family protein [Pseudomonadota bacterium]